MHEELGQHRQIKVNPHLSLKCWGYASFSMGVELLKFILTSMRVKRSQRKPELRNEDRVLRTVFGTWIQLCLKATSVEMTVEQFPVFA